VAVSSTRNTAGPPLDIRLQDSFSRPPVADGWVAGLATRAEDADVDLDEVERFCTKHDLWSQLA
jgi:hypothetical protein